MAYKDYKYIKLEKKVNSKLSKEEIFNIKLEDYKKITNDELPLKSGKYYIEHKSAVAKFFQEKGICLKYYPARIEFKKIK